VLSTLFSRYNIAEPYTMNSNQVTTQ